tara:strand:- start:19 stop:240 length:222 start_codon:yes stop_codon:yes gene_type:complete
MKKYESKEKLIKQLHNINYDYHEKVCKLESQGDLIGEDTLFYVKALKYVPNSVLKTWIRSLKNQIKKQGEKND